MEKLVRVILFLMCGTCLFAKGEIILKFGQTLDGDLKIKEKISDVSINGKTGTKGGETTIGIEYLNNTESKFNFGIGMDYEPKIKIKDTNRELNGYCIPMYVIGKFNLEKGTFSPYLSLKLGLLITQFDIEDFGENDKQIGKYYLGFGSGFEINDKWIFELSYTYFNFKFDYEIDNMPITDECEYDKLNFSIGYKFSLN